MKEPLAPEVDVVKQMMNSLPGELTEEQQSAVKELLIEHQNIFSKGSTTSGEHRMSSTALIQELIVLSDKLFKDTHLSIWTL